MYNQTGSKTEADKRALKLFIGGVIFLTLTINGVFLGLKYPKQTPGPSRSIPVEPEQPQVRTDDRAALKAAQDAAEKRVREEGARKVTEEASRRAAEEAASEHARYLARYLNSGFSRRPGTMVVAMVVASEDGKANSALADALVPHFSTNTIQLLTTFFRPAFLSDGLFSEVFNGSPSVLEKLELTNSPDALLLAREKVVYAPNSDLLNVLTADVQLDIVLLPVTGSIDARTWTFLATGAGFKRTDAKALAEERLVKQIASDTRMTLR